MNDIPAQMPVRMVNEYAYCPRLFHLMYVGERWDDNLYTDEGRGLHARLDSEADPLPPPPENPDEPPVVARCGDRSSVRKSSDFSGVAGRSSGPVVRKSPSPLDDP